MLRLTLQELKKLCVCFRRLFIVSFKKILTVEISKCTILHLIASAPDDIFSSFVIVRYPGQLRNEVKKRRLSCSAKVPKGCQP
jgi:hypothetical protein